MKLVKFPIIIFSYNRPTHLQKSLDVLYKNKFIKHHKIFFFNDGPKNLTDKYKIEKIKKIINQYKSLINFTEIKFNKKNKGLFKNIVSNVTKILKKNKAAIILEDDILAWDNSIEYMNFFLNKEINSKKIGSVSGYSYINNIKLNKSFNLFLSKRHSSWAWGTWSRVWLKFKLKYIDNKKNNIFDLKNEDLNSLGNDMEKMLWAHKNGFINSWAVLFNYFCYKEKYRCLQPRYSLIENIGFDISGTHTSFRYIFKKNKIRKKKFSSFNQKYILSKDIDNIIKKKHKESLKLKFFYKFNIQFLKFLKK
tara:strand:- start:1088 stop:2008 length:921 start_codon:yes stop_codon:yes gene_type:complete